MIRASSDMDGFGYFLCMDVIREILINDFINVAKFMENLEFPKKLINLIHRNFSKLRKFKSLKLPKVE
jgi:hypothetical protein